MAVGIASGVVNSILDALCRSVVWSEPAAWWIQLHTAEPGAAGTTAVAGNGTRKQPTFSAAGSGAITNSADIIWTAGEVDTSEDYTHWSAWDASTAGTFLQSGTMTANAVVVGDQFKIPAGDLDISIQVAS